MANNYFDQMRMDVGLLTSCTAEENARYNELLKNGEPLPEGIFQSADFQGYFYKPNPTVPAGSEQQYTLMRISKDLHFISTLLKVFLVLGILGMIASFIISGLQ